MLIPNYYTKTPQRNNRNIDQTYPVCYCQNVMNYCASASKHNLPTWFIILLIGPWEICDSKTVIFNLTLLIGVFRSSHDNALRWMPGDLTDDKSRLVHVMAWCRQATSHCLSQCWLSSLPPYGVARPQWVKIILEISLSVPPRWMAYGIESGRCWRYLYNKDPQIDIAWT